MIPLLDRHKNRNPEANPVSWTVTTAWSMDDSLNGILGYDDKIVSYSTLSVLQGFTSPGLILERKGLHIGPSSINTALN